jgi:hypothetical protein
MARHAVTDFLRMHPDELPTSRNAPPAPKRGFDVVEKYYDENMREVTDAKGNKAWMPTEDGGVITCCSGHTHRIHMRNSDPGRYFDDAGHEVSEEVAATMGFDVDRYRALRRERDTLARARESVAALRGDPPKVEAPKPTVDELRAKAAIAVSRLKPTTKWLDAEAKPLDPEAEMIRKVREAGQG